MEVRLFMATLLRRYNWAHFGSGIDFGSELAGS
jgi:hypothetical protein